MTRRCSRTAKWLRLLPAAECWRYELRFNYRGCDYSWLRIYSAASYTFTAGKTCSVSRRKSILRFAIAKIYVTLAPYVHQTR